MFLYPKFIDGVQLIASAEEAGGGMPMDISVIRLGSGASKIFYDDYSETALLLLKGDIVFGYPDGERRAVRKSMFGYLPSVLHFAKGTRVKVSASTDSEILVQKTLNEKAFGTKLYLPKDIEVVASCKDKWEDTALREVATVFDYSVAPYSNMVLGEIFVPQGRWFSYIPHSHPQPEVYYYRLERPEGFGACFIGEEAYTIKDGSVGAFPGGKTHAQVTAPGFPMYCCWMIRHLEGNPWEKTRIDDERYTWLLDV